MPLGKMREQALALADTELGHPLSVGRPAYQPLARRAENWAPEIPVPQPSPPATGGKSDPPSDAALGVSGTPITSGYLTDLGEYNPELTGRNAISVYEQMRRGDGQVRATLAACKLPVLAARWDVAPGKARPGRGQERKAKEVAEFARENLFGGLEFKDSMGGWVTQTWDDVLRNALLMLDFGCAVHEDVWTLDGSSIRLRRLASRLPLTFYRWHTDLDGETLLALEQWGYRRGHFLAVTLPAQKIARFTYQQEGANFWGMALLRAMYPHWYVKSKLYRIDAIACERNSLGVPVFRLSPGFSAEDRDSAYNFVTQLSTHEATGLVEPPGDPHTGLRIAGVNGQLRNLMPSIQHHNEMISRAALAMFMDLGGTAHGSRALGQVQGSFFLLALQHVADQIASTLTATSLRRLVRLNFGDEAAMPRLVAANVQARSLEEIVGSLTSLATAGLVVSEQNVRRYIRNELALPEESDTGLVAIRSETIQPGVAQGAVGGKAGARRGSNPGAPAGSGADTGLDSGAGGDAGSDADAGAEISAGAPVNQREGEL